jgi:hypothetical protein
MCWNAGSSSPVADVEGNLDLRLLSRPSVFAAVCASRPIIERLAARSRRSLRSGDSDGRDERKQPASAEGNAVNRPFSSFARKSVILQNQSARALHNKALFAGSCLLPRGNPTKPCIGRML